MPACKPSAQAVIPGSLNAERKDKALAVLALCGTCGDDGNVLIDHRFRGPARSGNGGYTSGLLAAAVQERSPATPVTVTLRTPPPLDTDLALTMADSDAELRDKEGTLVATAQPGSLGDAPAPVDPDIAGAVTLDYRGLAHHPFPTCFTCGPDRDPGDGLRLFPGAVPGRERTVATLWEPQPALPQVPGAETVTEPVVWAALDCPGAWSVEFASGRPIVLGQMTALIKRLPRIGEQCVVVGECHTTQGRKSFTGTALYGEHGDLLGHASAVWLTIDPDAFNTLKRPSR